MSKAKPKRIGYMIKTEIIEELQGILDDNVSDEDKLNQVTHFIKRLKND